MNSTQSQRIRNLESEITRLVAENVAWREQAIAAKAEAERWRRTNSVSEEILNLKEKLQTKVQEVSLLLAEMGDLPEKAARKAKRKSRIQTESLAEQDWKHRLSMREAAGAERDMHDGRLPAILEDKLYPRRTLESAEITALRNEEAMQHASESPELGPPPIAHFDVNDAISFDNPRRSLDGNSEEGTQLPTTLEKRRKRRTSALLQDMTIEDSSEPEKATPLLLKSGAKRKLDVTELEEPVLQPRENDDFVFQRRQELWTTEATGKKASRFTRAPGRENDKPAEATVPSPQKPAERKILAPKSTNSPAKRRVRVAQKLEVVKDDEQEKPSAKFSHRLNIPPPLEAQEIVPEPEKEAETNGLPPKTPAVLEDDVLSPISTEPSARTHQTKEAAISNSVEDVLNGSIGRGSRRSRPAVSYALPNLRDKMRRPTKDLVGAVEGIEKPRDSGARTSIRGTSGEPGNSDDPQSMDEGGLKTKHEKPASEEVRWNGAPLNNKEEPTSPLRDKERKEVSRDKSNTKSEQKHKSRQSYGDELEKAVDRLSIFDPPASSPMEEPHEQDARTTKRKSTTNLLSRRHSMQSSASDSAVDNPTKDNAGPLLSSRLNPTPRAPPPRPSSAASLRQNSSSSRAAGLKRSSSINSNIRPSGTDSSAISGNSIAPSTERAASRRRSMMV